MKENEILKLEKKNGKLKAENERLKLMKKCVICLCLMGFVCYIYWDRNYACLVVGSNISSFWL